MRHITLKDIRPVIDKRSILAAVRTALIGNWEGTHNSPPPTQLIFPTNDGRLLGDCHIKSATATTKRYFSIKKAAGFYDNPSRGYPVNSGLVLLMSSETGRPLAMIEDEGWLTAWRTAAAGALAAGCVSTNPETRLGIIGTGMQAELQAEWICSYLNLSKITIYGRSNQNALALARRLEAKGIGCFVANSAAELCSKCRLIITTTPACEPILMNTDVLDGTHIVALGADSPGKQELDPLLLQRAEKIIVDDASQCLDHGEFCRAHRLGLVGTNDYITLGEILADKPHNNPKKSAITIADLTGLGAQDLEVAALVYSALCE